GFHGDGVLAERLARRRQPVLIAPSDDNCGPFVQEQLGGGETDPAVAAGDDGDLVCKPLHFDPPVNFAGVTGLFRHTKAVSSSCLASIKWCGATLEIWVEFSLLRSIQLMLASLASGRRAAARRRRRRSRP